MDPLHLCLDHADQVLKREVAVGHEALDLVELTQVRRVHALVTEHTVDREVPDADQSIDSSHSNAHVHE